MSDTTSFFARPVTDAGRRAWQIRGYRVLEDILKLGQEQNLPVVTWKVTEHALVGEPYQVKSEERRAAFKAWAGALGLEVQPETYGGSGRTNLRATARGWRGRRTDVAILADIYDDEPDDG